MRVGQDMESAESLVVTGPCFLPRLEADREAGATEGGPQGGAVGRRGCDWRAHWECH